jgi:hypothetical protein
VSCPGRSKAKSISSRTEICQSSHKEEALTTYEKLREEADAPDEQIARAREAEFDGALAEVRKLVRLFGFSLGDVFGDQSVKRKLPDSRPSRFPACRRSHRKELSMNNYYIAP